MIFLQKKFDPKHMCTNVQWNAKAQEAQKVAKDFFITYSIFRRKIGQARKYFESTFIFGSSIELKISIPNSN